MSEEAAEHVRILGEIFGPDVARDGARYALLVGTLEQKERELSAGALAQFTAAYSARLGEIPPSLREELDHLAPKSLALATLLALRSDDVDAFRDAFEALRGTLLEGKVAGARQVLRGLLERRFGQLEPLHGLAIQTADRHEIEGCFERFLKAQSALEVVEPILPRLR
jgi:hypothetical protein